MLQNYFRIAVRTFLRQGGFSAINLLGLSIGLTCTFLIALWVQDERSYDAFHEQKEQLHQIISHLDFGQGEIYSWKTVPLAMGEAVPKAIPEVEQMCFLGWDNRMLFTLGEESYDEQGFYASNNFFELFSFPLLVGDPASVLQDPKSIVIGEELAQKFFGETYLQEAVGKTLTINEEEDVRITGIVQRPPQNSSIQFGYLLPVERLIADAPWQLDWGNFNFQGYALLTEGTSLDALHIKVDDLVKEYRGDNGGTSFEFQPLTEKRLYGDFENGENVGGRITYVRIFSVVAIFLLLIACINFMNLATARSSKRAKEIGIRKVVGGTRTSLIAQFFGESIFMALLALIVAVFLTSLLMPGFNLLTGKEMALPVGKMGYWFAAILIAVVAGLFAGSYPALLLSSFPIVAVVKGMFRLGGQNVTLRRILVVFQFALSIFLIISTIVIYRQLNYIQTKNLGLDKEQVLSVRLPQFTDQRMKRFRQKLENRPGIISVTASDQNPLSVGNSTTTVDWDGKGEEEELMFHGMRIGYDFVETFRIDLVSGRDFDPTYGMDSANYLINEQTMHTIGWNNAEEAVGQNLALWGKQGKVIGVMKDFHIASFYTPIEPLILTLEPWNTGQVFVRLKPDELSEGIESVESAFSELSPAYPFRYTFVDQQFNKMYLSETMMGRLATTSAILGIFIACLGLLGLAAFTAEQRTKEIGIRKVLGASVAELVMLLGKEFTWLVLIALAFAVPLAMWLLSGWLEEFTYRIPVEPWVHVIGGLSALLIAWGTIGYQAVKTATQDPAKALRTE